MGAQKPEETVSQDVDMETGDSVDPEKLKLDADVNAVQELREHTKQVINNNKTGPFKNSI